MTVSVAYTKISENWKLSGLFSIYTVAKERVEHVLLVSAND